MAPLFQKQNVDRAGKVVGEERRELLVDLWENCALELQYDLAALDEEDIPVSKIPYQRSNELELHGFARSSGNKIRASCRLMVKYASSQASGMENMRRLFGDVRSFQGNIRGLLELRLSQVSGADEDLVRLTKYAIRDILPAPNDSLVWARSIAERALRIIWEAELSSGKSLPESWKHAGTTFATLPPKLGQQCGLLRSITGNRKPFPGLQIRNQAYLPTRRSHPLAW